MSEQSSEVGAEHIRAFKESILESFQVCVIPRRNISLAAREARELLDQLNLDLSPEVRRRLTRCLARGLL